MPWLWIMAFVTDVVVWNDFLSWLAFILTCSILPGPCWANPENKGVSVKFSILFPATWSSKFVWTPWAVSIHMQPLGLWNLPSKKRTKLWPVLDENPRIIVGSCKIHCIQHMEVALSTVQNVLKIKHLLFTCFCWLVLYVSEYCILNLNRLISYLVKHLSEFQDRKKEIENYSIK